jgi:nicotinamidase-related amidase
LIHWNAEGPTVKKPVKTLTAPDILVRKRVRLNARTTALIVVDMQNDFARSGGALFVEDAETIIPNIKNLLVRARAANAAVVFTQDWHHRDDPEFKIWPPHAIQGTTGAEIVKELSALPNEKTVHKVRYDGFYGTDLDHYLRVRGVKNVVLAGTVSNICVLHTAGSAALRWYRVIVPVDAIAAITEFDQMSALRQIEFLYRGTLTIADGIVFG